jgi:hypothetical protein
MTISTERLRVMLSHLDGRVGCFTLLSEDAKAILSELLALRSPSPPEGAEWGPVSISAEAFDELEAAMTKPPEPTASIKAGAKLLRDMYGAKSTPSPPEGIGEAVPVAWRFRDQKRSGDEWHFTDRANDVRHMEFHRDIWEIIPLYAAPVPSPAIAEARAQTWDEAANLIDVPENDDNTPVNRAKREAAWAFRARSAAIRRTAQGGAT